MSSKDSLRAIRDRRLGIVDRGIGVEMARARIRRFASFRSSEWLALGAIVAIFAQSVLSVVMARGHVAAVLLGSGNGTPPIGAACLAISFVVVRLLAVVVAPGALLAAAVGLVARRISPDGTRDRRNTTGAPRDDRGST